jgi:hypothetical protein
VKPKEKAGKAKRNVGRMSAPVTPAPRRDPAQVRPRLLPGTDETSGEFAAAPSEQAELEQVVDKAMRMIHGRDSRDQTLRALHDPSATVAETVGRAAYRVLSAVSDQKRATTKEPVSETVLQEAAGYVVPELLKVGIAAGLFPIEDDSESRDEVGDTDSEFDEQVRLAMLEATKAYGENELRGPNGARRSEEAQDEWTRGVAQEVSSGSADPEFMQMAQSQLAPPQQQQKLIEEGA